MAVGLSGPCGPPVPLTAVVESKTEGEPATTHLLPMVAETVAEIATNGECATNMNVKVCIVFNIIIS